MHCIEAQRLLERYLIELRSCDRAQSAAWDPMAARENRERLSAARCGYWEHVEKHGCRQRKGRMSTQEMLARWISFPPLPRNSESQAKR